jgi:hypothetical protein
MENTDETRDHLSVAVRWIHHLEHYGSKRRGLRCRRGPGGLRRRRCRGRPASCRGRSTSCRRSDAGRRYPLIVRGSESLDSDGCFDPRRRAAEGAELRGRITWRLRITRP